MLICRTRNLQSSFSSKSIFYCGIKPLQFISTVPIENTGTARKTFATMSTDTSKYKFNRSCASLIEQPSDGWHMSRFHDQSERSQGVRQVTAHWSVSLNWLSTKSNSMSSLASKRSITLISPRTNSPFTSLPMTRLTASLMVRTGAIVKALLRWHTTMAAKMTRTSRSLMEIPSLGRALDISVLVSTTFKLHANGWRMLDTSFKRNWVTEGCAPLPLL